MKKLGLIQAAIDGKLALDLGDGGNWAYPVTCYILIIADKTALSIILLSFFEKGNTQKKLKIRRKIVVMLG